MTEKGESAGRPASTDSITGVLATIAVQARRTNRVRIDQLRAALDRATDQELDRVSWAAVERTAHQLAGSAGTFGFDGVSERARFLERFFAAAAVTAPDGEQLALARVALAEASEQLDGELRLG